MFLKLALYVLKPPISASLDRHRSRYSYILSLSKGATMAFLIFNVGLKLKARRVSYEVVI
jgi:hypothetical protein